MSLFWRHKIEERERSLCYLKAFVKYKKHLFVSELLPRGHGLPWWLFISFMSAMIGDSLSHHWHKGISEWKSSFTRRNSFVEIFILMDGNLCFLVTVHFLGIFFMTIYNNCLKKWDLKYWNSVKFCVHRAHYLLSLFFLCPIHPNNSASMKAGPGLLCLLLCY